MLELFLTHLHFCDRLSFNVSKSKLRKCSVFFFPPLPPTLRRAALINCCELNVQCVSHINHSLSSAKPRLTDPDSIFCNQLSYSVILMTQTKASLIFLCEKVAFETAHSCFPDVLRLVCRAALKAFYITVMVSTVDV